MNELSAIDIYFALVGLATLWLVIDLAITAHDNRRGK